MHNNNKKKNPIYLCQHSKANMK